MKKILNDNFVSKLIKTFSFSVKEPYEIAVIGKKYSSIKRNETLPNFVDKNISYLETWASERNISVNKNYIESNSCIEGSILKQNIHSETLVSSITTLNVDVCRNIHIEPSQPQASNETESQENTQNNEIDNVIQDILN